MTEGAAECVPCTIGSNCSLPGVLLRSLPLQRGYYRISQHTADVRRCPDLTRGGCAGGDDVEHQCNPTLTGLYCTLCANATGGYHYARGGADSAASCKACTLASVGVTAGAVVAVAACLVSATLAHRRLKRRMQWIDRAERQATDLAVRVSLSSKLRLLVGFQQLVTNIGDVYQVRQ